MYACMYVCILNRVDQLCIKFPDKVEWVDFWKSTFVLLEKEDRNGPLRKEESKSEV